MLTENQMRGVVYAYVWSVFSGYIDINILPNGAEKGINEWDKHSKYGKVYAKVYTEPSLRLVVHVPVSLVKNGFNDSNLETYIQKEVLAAKDRAGLR